MALAVDASTPVIASVGSGVFSVTTASFTPPVDSLLVAVCFSDNATGSSNDPAPTVTNSGTAFTWTLGPARNPSEDNGGSCKIYTAKVTVSQAMTVTYATGGSGGTGHACKLKVEVVTGQDLTSPIGATGEGSSATNNITPTVYTSTVDLSLAIGGAVDWSANGVPTSTDVEDGAHTANQISAVACYKASTTTPSGSAVTLNFDAAGAAAADWNWVAVEIKPAAGETVTIDKWDRPMSEPVRRRKTTVPV